MRMHDYDPREGQAFQGDIAFIPIPHDIPINRHDELPPVAGRLILQEGELTGHHHAIDVACEIWRLYEDDVTATPSQSAGREPTPPAGRARLYRDPSVARTMMRRGLLTRTDLAIGCLVVEGAPVVVGHEEHDGIRIPVGRYLVGRQVETVDLRQQLVAD